MAPHDVRRSFKRAAISDQQKRRELSLLRQAQNRRDAQQQARCLASYSKGEIPTQQQVVLELQDNGKLVTSDDPPVVFGCLDADYMIQQSGLDSGNLLRFAIGDGGLSFSDGKLDKADLNYLGKSNRARAFADSYSKVLFQYTVRHSPLKIDDLLASINSPDDQQNKPCDMDMAG
ncbi:hypothetical protein COLO4_31215 [Corchorus olitorius]|uniref:Uncharacterized protein n=1 Tax=Corchorus olitorius TaxID=93759 RepID=A0A1R3H551_9ROSI|nr:hypothetical protein COLO4_31215 [Corchorus olitorius]